MGFGQPALGGKLVIKKYAIFTFTLILVFFIYALFPLETSVSLPTPVRERGVHDFPENIDPKTYNDDFITYTEFRSEMENNPEIGNDPVKVLNNFITKKIRFDTAEELYRFSVDVSYFPNIVYQAGEQKLSEEMVDALLKLNYVLGCDIDYAVMKSKAFIPIGYSFNIATTHYRKVFQGSFDGRGFEINNLYVADYPFLTVEGEGEEHIVTTSYYSMFTYNEGWIRNLGLVNPTFELTQEHDDLSNAANLVGCNEVGGIVEYVYVIDDRDGDLNAGIRMRVPFGQTETTYSAAGIVHDNYGTFKNAYYVSPLVVHSSFVNSFLVQPVLFKNYATANDIENLVYDTDVYFNKENSPYQITAPNAYAEPEATDFMRSNSSLGSTWYYYPADRYPSLQGLKYLIGKYLIEDAVDFIVFAKLLNLKSVNHDRVYRASDFLITKDLDMSQVAPDAYTTPTVEFSGTLNGKNEENEENFYISNLNLKNGIIIDNNYYCGLFSVLTGRVEHITLSQAKLVLSDTDQYSSFNFNIGMIAGELRVNSLDEEKGKIDRVYVDAEIDLGDKTIGEISLGFLVGIAGGKIYNVYTQGNLDAGDHNFRSDLSITPIYHLGGIVGRTNGKLSVSNALNAGTIFGIGSTDNVTTTFSSVNIYLGGIIGKVTNQNDSSHFNLITNRGEIITRTYRSLKTNNQYLGGLIGLSEGTAYKLDLEFGDWTNEGILNVGNRGDNQVRAAGILISNHSQATEFIYLYNETSYNTNNFSNLKYTSLVYDLATTGVTISQSLNTASHTIYGDYDFSGVFHSENNAPSKLRFVENRGDITYSGTAPTGERKIAGITLSENINFLSVFFTGTITVKDIIQDSEQTNHAFWISGITHKLTENYILKDCINKGKIIFSNITSNANNYLSGLVNINESGDLEDQFEEEEDPDNKILPKAHFGIINSINYSDLTSTIDENSYGIKGSGNTFVGGIVTINRGSIQDSLNMGDIKFANLSDISSLVVFSDDDNEGGIVLAAHFGIIAGGVAAAAGNSDSRIYDCANSGDIIAQSQNFGRAGGVLALCYPREMQESGVPSTYYDNSIPSSVLSNCINYGNVSSITKNIYLYSTDEVIETYNYYYGTSTQGDSLTMTHRVGTVERPGIYSSAGGVIGYGLSIMRRMVNHGEVSSSDVSGGIVGATFAYPITGSNTTIVNIDTAINYGKVRAVKISDEVVEDYFDFERVNLDYEYIEDRFYLPDDKFIYPDTLHDIRKFPEGKRGIGGIFGRLQRARSHYMSSVGGRFTYIVNMDPDVDLIGRLDQVYNFTSSLRYFIFSGTDCLYYSAKENDTTQAAFTGVVYYRNSQTIQVTALETMKRIYYSGRNEYTDHLRQNIQYSFTATATWLSIGGTSTQLSNQSQYMTIPQSDMWYNISSRRASGVETITPIDPPNPYSGTTSASYIMGEAAPVPLITESPTGNGEFVYAEDFDMRAQPDLQEYIYFVENGILSDFFRPDRLYGMYVLSTSSGSTFGSALPSNIDLTKTYPLDGQISYDVDYENISLSDRVTPTYDPENPEPGPDADLETLILYEYQRLLQIRYNDKSALLAENQNISLIENGGSGTHLLNPEINGNIIIFDLSLDTINSEQSLTSYKINSVLIPANALVAMTMDKYVEMGGTEADFLQKLYQDRDDIISDQLSPILSIDLSEFQNTQVETTADLGVFVSYSQAAVHNSSFLYKMTEYRVQLKLKPRSGGAPAPSQYQLEGTGSLINFPSDGIITTSIISKIRITFTDPSYILPIGSSIKDLISLHYEYYIDEVKHSEVVDADYYTLSEIPVQGNHTFEFTLELSYLLRSGDYQIRYRFFAGDTERTISIKKAASTATSILYLEHYSYDDFSPLTGTAFTTQLNFGYPLDLTGIKFEVDRAVVKPYLDGKTYRIILGAEDKEGEEFFFTAFQIPVFSELVRVYFEPAIFGDGYMTYHIRYEIKSESDIIAESQNGTIYYHSIEERKISLETASIYKDNNRVPIDNIFCTREALSTKFAIDFGIDQKYSALIYNLFQDNPDAYFGFLIRDPNGEISEEVFGVEFSADNYLNITFDYDALPGRYEFTISYHRDNEVINFNYILVITKNAGINAYLKDIRFSESLLETDYAEILVSDDQGNGIISEYSPRVYFAGIDYDDAENKVFDFRINGTVANIPLDDYTPVFLKFLPAGATIARKTYPIDNMTEEYTDEVDMNSSDEMKAKLGANFTLNPYTGQEPAENEDVVITYRVTSENGEQKVFYHITVIDIDYNVTLVFNVYFEVNGEKIPANIESSPLLGWTVLINVKNFNTNVEPGDTQINDIDDFLRFDNINPDLPYNNNVNMFYHLNNANYRFRFGRNRSGFYAISVDLPDGYTCRIEYIDQVLKDVSDYVNSELENPLEYGIDGKYFYINKSKRYRTRYFDLIISETTTESEDWGLFDWFKSWFK